MLAQGEAGRGLRLKLFQQFGFELQYSLGFVQQHAGDEESILGTFTQRIDLGGMEMNAMGKEYPGNAVEQAGTVAGNERQHLIEPFFIRLDADLWGNGKVLQLSADSAARRCFQRSGLA